jgi:hypothetical protein
MKNLNHSFMFLATHWKPNIEIWQLLIFLKKSLLAIENLQAHLNFEF